MNYSFRFPAPLLFKFGGNISLSLSLSLSLTPQMDTKPTKKCNTFWTRQSYYYPNCTCHTVASFHHHDMFHRHTHTSFHFHIETKTKKTLLFFVDPLESILLISHCPILSLIADDKKRPKAIDSFVYGKQ